MCWPCSFLRSSSSDMPAPTVLFLEHAPPSPLSAPVTHGSCASLELPWLGADSTAELGSGGGSPKKPGSLAPGCPTGRPVPATPSQSPRSHPLICLLSVTFTHSPFYVFWLQIQSVSVSRWKWLSATLPPPWISWIPHSLSNNTTVHQSSTDNLQQNISNSSLQPIIALLPFISLICMV